MLLLIGIGIGILFSILVEPLIKGLSDLFSCLIDLAQMAVTEKVAQYESRILAIRAANTQDIPETTTRAIGFITDSDEEEYDDDDN